ncbi:MAG: hypothetical protein V1688_01220 [bacterium]
MQEKYGGYGQVSQEKSPEGKEEREKLNNEKRQQREEEGVDWFLLSSAASLIEKYLKTKGKDRYAGDLLKDGDCVVYEGPGGDFPEELKKAVDGGIFDIIGEDGDHKVVLSMKTKKSYENYKMIKDGWNQEAE